MPPTIGIFSLKLSQATRPDLYRINAFRVAQLHAGASPRELTRKLERIKMLAKLGGQAQEPAGPVLGGDDLRAGGEVEVRVGTGLHEGRVCAIVSVRDQGTGIEAANLDRIFDLFQQGSKSPVRGHVGLGLGLYVARQIARAHQGDVWAESPGEGQGSTFYLALPLDLSPTPTADSNCGPDSNSKAVSTLSSA